MVCQRGSFYGPACGQGGGVSPSRGRVWSHRTHDVMSRHRRVPHSRALAVTTATTGCNAAPCRRGQACMGLRSAPHGISPRKRRPWGLGRRQRRPWD
eukprot:4511484-Prymnesium_polylepis.1